ncbi:MAG: HNH endonuclease [Fimbriimonadia bacterium]|nr:HNH endonuclease [Fimbriimonadia bacterium]
MKEISEALRESVRKSANHRCGYCLSPQQYVMSRLEIEHIIPRSKGGSNDETNLWLSCSLCNRFKGAQTTAIDPQSGKEVPLFNPRFQSWREHFQWEANGTVIEGLTPTGRATVVALQLNNELAIEVRRNWILAGWHPPI